jgi:hypothetical protein
MTPTISTAYDLDSGEYVMHITSHGRTMPAGQRIFRAPPHPDVRFRHESEAEAESDAAKVHAYLAGLGTKRMTKQKIREGANELETDA